MVRAFVLALLAACSGKKPREDAVLTQPHVADAAPVDVARVDATGPTTGDLQVRVEWRDVPVPMRASPGRTSCNTPRTPAVAPTTTWGIPDVLVVVDGAPVPSVASRIVLADCALAPRLVVATAATLESAADRPTKVTLAKRGELASIDKLDAGSPRPVQLPIAGHAVALPLDANGIYEVAIASETAWLVASPNAGVTEPNGQLLVKDLAPGKYSITVWLPPRGGAAAKLARASTTVVAGDLAEITLELK